MMCTVAMVRLNMAVGLEQRAWVLWWSKTTVTVDLHLLLLLLLLQRGWFKTSPSSKGRLLLLLLLLRRLLRLRLNLA